MLTIAKIKRLPPDTKEIPPNPSFKAVVLDVGPVEAPQGKGKAKFFSILADKTDSISCTVYKESDRFKFTKGMGVVLMDIMIKQSYIAVTEKSEVALCKGFEIPTEIQGTAPKLPGEPLMNISMVLHSPVKTLTGVKGKVVKIEVPTTKEFDDQTIPFQDIYLKEKEDKVCVALWGSMVERFELGQIVKISKCKVKIFNGEKKLSTTQSSTTSEVVDHDSEFDDVLLSDEDVSADGASASSSLDDGIINAVFDMDPYLICPNKRCNNTKLITVEENVKYYMKCKSCKVLFSGSATNMYLRSTVLVETNQSARKVAIFLPQIKRIFDSRGVKLDLSFDKNKLIDQMLEMIPIQGKFKIINNTVRTLVVKRDRE